MAKCVNLKNPEIKKLASQLGIHEAVIAAKIFSYQEQTNNDEYFPTVEQLENFIKVGNTAINLSPEVVSLSEDIDTNIKYLQDMGIITKKTMDGSFWIKQGKTDNINKGFKDTKKLSDLIRIKEKRGLDWLTYTTDEKAFRIVIDESKLKTKNLSPTVSENYESDINHENDFENDVEGLQTHFEKSSIILEKTINNLKTKLESIDYAKKVYSKNKKKLLELRKLEEEARNLLEGTKNEKGLIDELNSLKDITKEKAITSHLEIFLNRAKSLVKSEVEPDVIQSSLDSNEADLLVRYLESLNPEENTKNHPLFNEEDILDVEGNIILPQEIIDILKQYQTQGHLLRRQMEVKKEKIVVDNFNLDPLVKKTFGDKRFEFKDIFKSETGMKDISWVDMFIYDGQKAIFSKNPEVRQVMQNILDSSLRDERNVVKGLVLEIDRLTPLVQAELLKLAKNHAELNLDNKPDFSIFQAKSEFGFKKKGMVQRFTNKFFRTKNRIEASFFQEMSQAKDIQNLEERKNFIKAAYNKKIAWYKENSEILNILLLPEIMEKYSKVAGKEFDKESSKQYKDKLLNILGEKGYNEIVNSQLDKIEIYNTLLESTQEELLSKYGVESVENLPSQAVDEIDFFIKTHSPFKFVDNYHNDTKILIGKEEVFPRMDYNTIIPNKYKKIRAITEEGSQIVETSEETGYYDNNFSIIENNPILLEFHGIVSEIFKNAYESLPIDERENFSPFDIPLIDKTLVERLYSAQGFEKISEFWKWLKEEFQKLFTEKISNSLSYAKKDPLTGKPEYTINNTFLRTHSRELQYEFNLERLKVIKMLGLELNSELPDSFNLEDANTETIIYLSEKLKVPADLESVRRKLSLTNIKEFNFKNFVYDSIVNELVESKSMDLPKIVKTHALFSADYRARQNILPILSIMKEYYDNIKNINTDNNGEEIITNDGDSKSHALRNKAVRQLDSWFERAVLGNYTSRNEFGRKKLNEEKLVKVSNKISKIISNKRFSPDEKEGKKDIAEYKTILQNEKEKYNNLKFTDKKQEDSRIKTIDKIDKRLSTLDNIESSYGRFYSFKAFMDNLLTFNRWKGLGWNLNSSITNFMEGQMANYIIASNGKYFKEETFYRANKIVRGSTLKMLTANAVNINPELRKLSLVVKNYDFLQDMTNEMQKQSKRSAFTNFSAFSPFELTRRVEYVNQTPVALALLMETGIEGFNGEKSNVWDALDNNGKLLSEFATDENRINWEILLPEERADILKNSPGVKSDSFNSKMQQIVETLILIHGDYNDTRGFMASEYISGKMVFMFKRWLTSYLFTRFASPQTMLALGEQEYKGRYRSLTSSTGLALGSFVGLLAGGPLLTGVLAGAGFLGGAIMGVDTHISIMKEMAATLKNISLKFVGMPINFITGKYFIKQDWKAFENSGMAQSDINNVKDLITEITLYAWLMAGLLFLGMGYDDDEEEFESVKDKSLNVLSNKFLQISNQGAAFLNGGVIGELVSVQNTPIPRFAVDVIKTIDATGDALMGDDIIASGINSGKSKLWETFSRTFLPSPLKGSLGFSKPSERLFYNIPGKLDKILEEDTEKERKQLKGLRAKYRRELKEQEIPKKQRDKMVNEKYPLN